MPILQFTNPHLEILDPPLEYNYLKLWLLVNIHYSSVCIEPYEIGLQVNLSE